MSITTQMKYFIAVYDAKSFTKGAKLCNISQPSLSTAIQDFEDKLSAKLFLRDTKNIKATPLAKFLYPKIKSVLQQQNDLIIEAINYTRVKKIPIKIVAESKVSSSFISTFSSLLYKHTPQVEIEIQQREKNHITRPLIENADIIVINRHDKRYFNFDANILENFKAIVSYKEYYKVLYNKTDEFENISKVVLKDLNNKQYIDRLGCERREDMMSLLQEKKINLYASIRVSSDLLIEEMVSLNLGIAIIPEFYRTSISSVRSKPLDIDLYREFELLVNSSSKKIFNNLTAFKNKFNYNYIKLMMNFF